MSLEQTARRLIDNKGPTLKKSILGIAAGLGLAYAVHGSFHIVAAGYHQVQSERASMVSEFKPKAVAYIVPKNYTEADNATDSMLEFFLRRERRIKADDLRQKADNLQQYHRHRIWDPFHAL